ncbi:MAG: hypothetical protein LBH70_06450, partial [Spirochaetaceae bacterium]|nr:hypothetical protein [Spirochaetaceae bacterium]
MPVKKSKKRGFIFALPVVVYTGVLAAPLCAGPRAEAAPNAAEQTVLPPSLEMVRAEPPEKPEWVYKTPESGEFIYFTGMGEAAAEAEARSAALKNGVSQAAAFYGNLVKEETSERSVAIEDLGKTITERITYDEKLTSYIDAVVSGVKEAACYTEYYRSRTNREFYKVWVLCQIPRKK